ncbi:P-loop containing nucleoside triphosphate hydrolase protein [Aspergillus crustosus]
MFKGLSRWLFGSTEYSVLIIGNDASGKTALLYRLKLNEFVNSIPTIGFNVETIEYPRGWRWTIWDVGGCDKIQPLLRHYLNSNTLVLFLHDCQDRQRPEFPDWLHGFLGDMIEVQSKYLWILPTKQDDLPDRGSLVSGVKQMYEEEMAQYARDIRFKVLEHKLSAKTGEGLQEVMAELYQTMSAEVGKISQPQAEPVIAARNGPVFEEKLKALIEREGDEDILDAQLFWESFVSAKLPTWGHRNHLKAGYIIVLESAGNGESIFTTADVFVTHLKRLKETHPDRFRNTEHRTMTIFWLLDMQLKQLPSWSDFQAVLLHSPSLVNMKLWSSYYTKDRLFTQEAKESWTVPDLKQFPVLRPGPAQDKPVVSDKDDSDWLLQFAFVIIQHILRSGLRRGAVIRDALASLQATTIRLRALKNPKESALPEKTYEAHDIAELGFSHFTLLFDITAETWREYYTRDVWVSVAARMEFVPPDIKPLPNVIRVSPDAHRRATI